MADPVLVAYATRYGSTKEVAEAVTKALKDAGVDARLLPAREVQSLDGYRAVVLGTPLYIGKWLKDIGKLLTRHQGALTKLPVALFVLGPTGSTEGEWQEIRASVDKLLMGVPWLKPVAWELFGGKLDPAKLGFPYNLLLKLPASPLYNAKAVDSRDWEAIAAWAKGLAGKL